MRYVLLSICLMVISTESTHGSTGGVSVSLISHDLDGMLVSQYQVGIMPSIFFDDVLRISVPVIYTQYENQWMIDVSGHIAYYPMDGSIWVGMTMLQNIILYDRQDEQQDHIWMHEISLGYDAAVSDRVRITPCIVFRDPFRRFQEECRQVQESFPSWGGVEIGIHITTLLTGWTKER